MRKSTARGCLVAATTISLLLAGCSAHSPMIARTTTDSEPVSATKYPSHGNKVLVLVAEESLPPSAKYEVVSQIDVGMARYGSTRTLYQLMATRARALGADAVIEVKTWHQPSGWSWSAPHGSGKAIKVLDKSTVDLSKLKGEWF